MSQAVDTGNDRDDTHLIDLAAASAAFSSSRFCHQIE